MGYNKNLNEILHKQGIIQDKSKGGDQSSRSVVKKRQRKGKDNTKTENELLNGFWPKREDFDIEYKNDAELIISEIEFTDETSEAEKNSKLEMLKIYNCELKERNLRKA